MTRSRWFWIAIVAIAASGALWIPIPPGNPAETATAIGLFASLISAAIAAGVALPLLSRRPGTWRWAAIALAVGVAASFGHDAVRGQCVARYAGKPALIGTELEPWAAEYKRAHPEKTNDDLLFDAGGSAPRAWTPASIARCRSWLRYTYFLWFPLCSSAILSLMAAPVLGKPRRIAPAATPPARPATEAFKYDAFLSYRHGGEDTRFAHDLVDELERAGFAVAIDERDFRANESFLEEMERCIRESRFVLAVVSGRYVESGNTNEEAVITKTLDLAERRRRLIPLIIEPTTLPAWMYTIVGIDFTKEDPLTDPMEKLKAALRCARGPVGDAV